MTLEEYRALRAQKVVESKPTMQTWVSAWFMIGERVRVNIAGSQLDGHCGMVSNTSASGCSYVVRLDNGADCAFTASELLLIR